MFTTIIINGQEYKLRLRTVDVIQVEKRLGHNLMDMFMGIQDEKLPQLRELLTIVHASMLAYNHGITEAKLYELYDQWIEEGHTMFDLVPIVLELLQNGGVIPKDVQEEPVE